MPKKILDLGSKVMYNPAEILAHKPLRDLAFPSPSAAQGLFYGKYELDKNCEIASRIGEEIRPAERRLVTAKQLLLQDA